MLVEEVGSLSAQGEELIPKGVSIGSVDVGGMSAKEAQAAVDSFVSSVMEQTYTLKGSQASFDVKASDLGVSAQTEGLVEEAMEVARTGNLIDRFKEQKELDTGDFALDMRLSIDREKTAQLIYDHKSQMDIPAEDNRVVRQNGAFTYVEGQKGEEVDVVESVYRIEDILSESGASVDEIELVIVESEPRGSREELESIQDVLGEFSTNFGSSSYERATNVRNGASKINGTILYPGEEFSVYETVSPFTEENGYELAGSYANGTTVESFGGGICQVSTTLYNAAIRAELEIVARYNHSMIVGYVEPSMDAAIAGTYKDFKFRNNYDTPIYLQGYCEGGQIFFIIYGKETRPANRTVSFESEVLETTEPDPEIHVSSEFAIGYTNTEQSSHTGYVAQLWKVVKEDGTEVSREIFNHSTYKASPRIVTIGVKGATDEQIKSIKAAAAEKDEAKAKSLAAEAKNQLEEEEQEPEEEEASEDADSSGETDKTGKSDSSKKSDTSDTAKKTDTAETKSDSQTTTDDTDTTDYTAEDAASDAATTAEDGSGTDDASGAAAE